MGDVREEVAKLFDKPSETAEISLALLDAPTDKNASIVSLEFLDAPSTNKEDYISLNLLDKTASLMCEHLSIRALECNVGGFAHLECSNPSFHESCPFKLVHAELRKRKF